MASCTRMSGWTDTQYLRFAEKNLIFFQVAVQRTPSVR